MSHHVSAYAAQSAFFFMLSMIPIILLLLTLVQYTPATKADILAAVLQVFPSSAGSLITDIVNQVYNQTFTTVSLSVLVVLWSAGRGVMAITSGLNLINDYKETRSYIVIRIRATLYTVLFVLMITLLLLLSVFGDSLSKLLTQYAPMVGRVIDFIVSISAIVTPVLMVIFMLLVYRFLPNRKDTFFHQLPGSVFTAIGWMVVSWIFSIYLDIFPGFSSMYGSMATIVLVMLWLYFIMYIILLGGEVNRIVFTQLVTPKKEKDSPKEEEGSLKEEEAAPKAEG